MRSTAVCGRPCLVCSRAASADVSAAGAAPSTRRYAPMPPRESGAGPAAEPASGQCERNAARASAQSRAGRVSASVPGPPGPPGLAAGTKPYPAPTRPTTSARTVACRARPPSRRRRKRAGHADGAGTQARPRKSAGTTINRPVEGMRCASCVGRVERARSKVEGMTCASRVGRVERAPDGAMRHRGHGEGRDRAGKRARHGQPARARRSRLRGRLQRASDRRGRLRRRDHAAQGDHALESHRGTSRAP